MALILTSNIHYKIYFQISVPELNYITLQFRPLDDFVSKLVSFISAHGLLRLSNAFLEMLTIDRKSLLYLAFLVSKLLLCLFHPPCI